MKKLAILSLILILGVAGLAVATDWSISGVITGTRLVSTIATGTAPLAVTSTTVVPNLNVSSLGGATFAAPGAIGGGTPSTGAFTTLSATTSATIAGLPVPITLCSGQMTFNPSSIASGASETITQSCTNLATTDNIDLDFSGSPLAVTGYVPSVNGIITIIMWPSAGQINVAAVNNTASAIDPGSVTLNYRVVR